MTTPRDWLVGLQSRGIRLGLERMRQVLEDIELPDRVIRVGGTNGKGSVCAFLDSILQQIGHDIGVYTSPEVECMNERITINGTAISDEELDQHARWLMHQDVELTFFEAMTAIALRHFQGVDITILEVGMGGRCDATAAIDTDLTVITNVSLEHTQHLGTSIEAIAEEIAGAITGGDVVTACTEPALGIVEQAAARWNATLHLVTDDMWQQVGLQHFTVTSDRHYELMTRLPGVYQGQNIALAVKTAEVLDIPPVSIIDGIAQAWLPGRMEYIGTVLLDAAHNPAAMQALRSSLEDMHVQPRCIVFGVMQDKNIPGIIAELPPGDIIVTAAETQRAANPVIIAEMLNKAGRSCITAETPASALEKARELAGRDVILVTGSIRLIGNIRKLLH